jgi:acetyl-CoA acetyltransferase
VWRDYFGEPPAAIAAALVVAEPEAAAAVKEPSANDSALVALAQAETGLRALAWSSRAERPALRAAPRATFAPVSAAKIDERLGNATARGPHCETDACFNQLGEGDADAAAPTPEAPTFASPSTREHRGSTASRSPHA